MKLAVRLLVMAVALLAVVAVASSGPPGAAADHTGAKLYWTDAGTDKIQRANLDGTGVEDLVTSGLDRPLGIALDIVNTPHKMYWTDGGTDKIQRADLNGTNVEDRLTGPSDRVGLALDLVSDPQKMYWTDFLGTKIKRANLDGTSEELLVTTQCCPVGIALDVGAGEMYWTLRLGVDKIQRANLNGAGVEDLVTAADGLSDLRGIALDLIGGKMYWADAGTDKIQRANLNGTGVEDLVTSGLIVPVGMALDVFGGKMYWADNGTDKIQRANLNGTGVEDLVTAADGLSAAVGIALDLPASGEVRSPIVFSACDLSARVVDTPPDSGSARPRLIQSRVTCSDELLFSLETGVEELASRLPVGFPSIDLAMSSLSSLATNIEVLQDAVTAEDLQADLVTDAYLAVKANIGELDAALSSVGDDAQLANIDLQDSLQKLQQTLKLLSNIMKTKHDTAMSIIRKIR